MINQVVKKIDRELRFEWVGLTNKYKQKEETVIETQMRNWRPLNDVLKEKGYPPRPEKWAELPTGNSFVMQIYMEEMRQAAQKEQMAQQQAQQGQPGQPPNGPQAPPPTDPEKLKPSAEEFQASEKKMSDEEKKAIGSKKPYGKEDKEGNIQPQGSEEK